MKKLKKIIITILLIPICAAALSFFSALAVLNWPTILINKTFLHYAAKRLKPVGVDVSWKHVDTDFKSQGFLTKTIQIKFEDLCLSNAPELESACFKKLFIAARYQVIGFIPHLVAIGPISIDEGNLSIDIASEKKEDKTQDGLSLEWPEIKLPFWLKNVSFYPFDIELSNINLNIDQQHYIGKLHLVTSPNKLHKLTKINISGLIDQLNHQTKIHFDLIAKSMSGYRQADAKILGSLSGKLPKKTNIDLKFNLSIKGNKSIEHDFTLSLKNNQRILTAHLNGKFDKKVLITNLQGSLKNISDLIPRAQTNNCSLQLSKKGILGNKGILAIDCPINFDLKKINIPSDAAKVYAPPRNIRVNVSAQAKTFFKPDLNQKIKGKIWLRLNPLKQRLVTTKGNIDIDFAGIPAIYPKDWNLKTNLDVDFKIADFSHLVKVLQQTKFPVPAPFNVLDGKLTFSLDGHLSSLSSLGSFPIKLKTKLESSKQKIYMDSQGELRLALDPKKKNYLKLKINLKDVQLQLPDISLAAIPSFTPDSRIELESKSFKSFYRSNNSLDYNIEIQTPKNNPVRILSNITPEFIPIFMNIQLKPEELTGLIKIKEFPVKFFKRQAHVDKINLELYKTIDYSLIDASFSMDFPELKVIVLVKGPVSGPAYILDSKPPMTRGDIISMLLYGEPMNDINSDQASSVNNMHAAMSDQALGLSSFLLLGSTPVQSIAYNPATKNFAARLRLGAKFSLTLGGGQDEKYVRVSRRLGHGFRISTGMDKTEDDSEGTASAMIEWNKRY